VLLGRIRRRARRDHDAASLAVVPRPHAADRQLDEHDHALEIDVHDAEARLQQLPALLVVPVLEIRLVLGHARVGDGDVHAAPGSREGGFQVRPARRIALDEGAVVRWGG
ncbi:MAG: hypothetical protein Q9191_003867, partial [Dirinaria sp. TL-2023a]